MPRPHQNISIDKDEGNDSEQGEGEVKLRGSTNLLKLLNGTLVDTSALVDQVACSNISMRGQI